jgi:DNA-binding winged helix-turn-helix (wHTH) protein
VSRLYKFGQLRLDADGRALFRGSSPVPLPPKVAETLVVLVENAGRVVSKEELLRKVWPDTFIEEGSLTRTISILRRALDDGSGQEYIATLSKRGYRFAAQIEQVSTAAKSAQTDEVAVRPTPTLEGPHELVECDFQLTDRVCRLLDRATLDPLIIGDHLYYADNQVHSDVLVFFLHGLGLDHRDFEPVLMRLPYRGVSPTLYGCEPDRRGRISLSLADHVVILRELLRDLAERLNPRIIVMVGFSMGADIGFELLLGPADKPAPTIDAFLSLECNLSLETCTISRVLAELTEEHLELSVNDLRQLGHSVTSLEKWLNIHEYLVKVLRKFHGDIGVLRRAAADIVIPFRERTGFQVFAHWLQGARGRVRALRLVFPNDAGTVAALAKLRLENLDSGILGGEFPETVIHVSDKTDHFDMMSTQDVLQQVGELVAELRPLSPRDRQKTSA